MKTEIQFFNEVEKLKEDRRNYFYAYQAYQRPEILEQIRVKKAHYDILITINFN